MSTDQPQPALSPPHGISPDFNASNPLYGWNVAVQTLCIAIPTILMAIRVAVRTKIMKRWLFEDWLCLIALLFLLCQASMSAYEIENGGGQHMYNITHSTATTVLYWVNITQIIYSLTILSTKLALCSLYIGLFTPARYSKRWWLIITIMLLNSGFYTGLMFAKIFQCIPRDAIWDKTIANPRCISLVAILDVSGVWNTVSDVVILCLPLVFVFKLRLTLHQKIGICAIFAIGVIAPVMSLVGVVIRIQTSSSSDLTFYQPHLTLLAEAECAAGTICTCLPCLQRLHRWYRGDRQSSYHVSGGLSQTNRFSRKRRTMTYNIPSDTVYMGSDYMELGDANGGVKKPERMRSTNAAPSKENLGPEVRDGQIWRTTEITVDSESIQDKSNTSHGS